MAPIVAIAMAPLFSLEMQATRNFAKQRELRLELTAQRNALALLRDVNFMEQPAGALPLGDGRSLAWRATPLSRTQRSTRFPSGEGDFEVALYRVQAEIRGLETPHSFMVEKVGWRRLSGP